MDGKKPANYLACIIRPPRSPNVDVGYTAEALAIELEIGKITFQDMCAADNKDWRQQLRASFQFEDYKNQLAAEFPNVDPSKIANFNFRSGKTNAQTESAQIAADATKQNAAKTADTAQSA